MNLILDKPNIYVWIHQRKKEYCAANPTRFILNWINTFWFEDQDQILGCFVLYVENWIRKYMFLQTFTKLNKNIMNLWQKKKPNQYDFWSIIGFPFIQILPVQKIKLIKFRTEIEN